MFHNYQKWKNKIVDKTTEFSTSDLINFHDEIRKLHNDLCKLHRVLWRGFDHGDEPPDDGFEERTFMQSAPNYRKDLNIVVVAPDSNFVSYCGMWYEPINRIAYVEPVTTDPDYRRMGLGCTVVMEGIRRCGELGATVACVGATMIFIFQWDFTKHMTVLSGSENGHRNRKNYER